MQAKLPTSSRILVLGTGGTIAGEAARPDDNVGYRAAQRSVRDLLSGVPQPEGIELLSEQVAQLDSKDMDHATWQRLLLRVREALVDEAVRGLVITHGTDTLEETALFLNATLGLCAKPVVLTCSMRPATALGSDGPQNLADALAVAADPQAAGVLVVCAGVVHDALAVQKVHTYQPDAFSSGDAGLCARLYEGRVNWQRSPVPLWDVATAEASAQAVLHRSVESWPWVAVLHSHAGAQGRELRAWLAQGLQGLVVAGTGNGTLHQALDAELHAASARGLTVWRSSRCPFGPVIEAAAGGWPIAAGLNAVKARVALMLHLMR